MNINFVKQINKYRKAILYLVLVLCIILLIAWGISLIYSLPISSMLDDPASMFEYNEFIGFTTFIGIIVLRLGLALWS
jgi:short subunit fatty acids transporter